MTDDRRALPQTPMRRAIARAMIRSKQEVPHFYVTTEVDLEALRSVIASDRDGAAGHVTMTAYFIAALARALGRHPEFNAVWNGDQLELWSKVNLAVAVATDAGLLAPALLDIASVPVKEVALRLHDLVTRTKAGNLRAAELSDGTFTLSNLGMFDVTDFTAIVVPPQVAILALGRGTDRAVVRGGEITVRPVMTATLSADHRAVDGVAAATFLGTFKTLVERPETL